MKAFDHDIQKRHGLQCLESEWMSGLSREEHQKRELRASVALSEGMDGIQFGRE